MYPAVGCHQLLHPLRLLRRRAKGKLQRYRCRSVLKVVQISVCPSRPALIDDDDLADLLPGDHDLRLCV